MMENEGGGEVMNEYEMTEVELELWLSFLSAIFGVELPRPEREKEETTQ